MPFINNAASPLLAQYSQLADNIAGLGKAFGNPDARLARAKIDALQAETEREDKKYGLLEAKQPYELNVLQAQAGAQKALAGNYNAEAAYHNAQARSQDLVGKDLQNQMDAQRAIAGNLRRMGVPDAESTLAQNLLIAGSSKSTSANNADAVNTIINQNVKLGQGDTALLPYWSKLLPQNQPKPSQVAPEPSQDLEQPTGKWRGFPYKTPGQVPVPFAQPQQDVSVGTVRLGSALPAQGQPSNAPIFDGNVVRVPAANMKGQLTPAQTAIDESFGKEYAQGLMDGRLGDVDMQLNNLRTALGSLKSGAASTGNVIGHLPDAVNRAIGNGPSVDMRQNVEATIQRSLRPILGAQFTEQEGERLIKRAFDPTASPQENARRLGTLIQSLSTAATAKRAAFDYYQKNGTLAGWNGALPSMATIESSFDAPSATEELIPVVGPDGKNYKLPASKLDAATQRGFKRR